MHKKEILNEIKVGLKETSKYVLSHHPPNEYFKCYSLMIGNKKIYFCARCLGIYLGIFLGIIIYSYELFIDRYYAFIIIFPIFTFIDWAISGSKINRSYNYVRTFFGILLGIAYILGLILFIETFPNIFLTIVVLFYITITFLLLFKFDLLLTLKG